MTRRVCFVIVCSWVAVIVTLGRSPAQAQPITAFWQQVPISPAAIADDPQLAGMQSWDLMVTTTGDWYRAGLRATLPAGSFYNHFHGGSTMPSSALIAAFPAVEFDTYVTAPNDRGGAGVLSIIGGFPGSEPFSMSGNVFSVRWGDLVMDPPGSYPIARLTFPQGVIPDVLTLDDAPEFSQTSQIDPDSATAIPEIPEPTALWICVVGGFLALQRRAN